MRVLVTGGAGYVGSVVSGLLLERGHRVRVLDSLVYGGQSLLGLYSAEGFEFVRADVRSGPEVDAALEGIEAVVHLAAIVGDAACGRQTEVAREVNLDASLQLAGLSRARGVGRFLFASTCSNYGRMGDALEYVTEESELRPLSLYAETKVAVEEALLERSPNGRTAATVLRFATVFGLSPRMRLDLTVNEFAAELTVRRRLTVYGEQFWRPYVHVRDAARAIATVLEAPLELVDGQVFNAGGTSENYRKGAIVELVREQVGGDVVIERVQREEDPRDYRVSFERIRERLGFELTRGVRDGIREVIDAVGKGVIADFDDPRYRN